MIDHYLTQINALPGIQRDGTRLDSDKYIDGEWVRFYKGKPRKIGGYKLIDSGNNEIIRNMFVVPKDNSVDVYLGRPSSLSFINKNFDGTGGFEIDRTPSVQDGFIPDPNNTWSFDLFTIDLNGTPTTYIIAQVAPNAIDISSNVEGPVFYGNINDTLPLQPLPTPKFCSGGVLAVPPYLFIYGNDGTVDWSLDLVNWNNAGSGGFASISGTKIVAAMRTRGGGAPSALFWTVNSLIRATFNPTTQDPNGFAFDTVRDDISILSSNSIIEYNQMFFWPGNGVFYNYNGIVQVLPNEINANYFFDNYNYDYRERIFGMQIARYKELWWPYPTDSNTENNRAIIYNVELNTWYDTSLNRSCGFPAQVFPYPLMCDSKANNGVYSLWMHEYGWNREEYNNVLAITSYFETNVMVLGDQNAEADRQTRIRRIEPDFNQVGEMNVYIVKRAFANSIPISQGPYPFDDTTTKIDTDGVQGRQYSFKFISNTIDGFFQMGKVYINWLPGDVTPNS